MNTKVNLCFARYAETILIVFMVCVTVIVSTNSYAKAQGGGETNTLTNEVTQGSAINVEPVVPGGPGYIMVSPFEFRPYYPTTQWAYYSASLYNPNAADDSNYMVAGLTLPHGASIKKVTIFYYDNSAVDLYLILYKASMNGVSEVIEFLSPSGASTEPQYFSQTITSEKIDNQNYSYYLGAGLPPSALSNVRISNVRIDYEYTVYTPTIMK